MDYRQFEGHTPAEEWTTYSMGVHADGRLGDNPYHAVRIGGEGFDLPITKGADARLLAAAPELLAENKRYRKTLERIAREDYNQNHYEHTEERHIWNMMHNMIQQARMALGQDIETGELRAEEFGADTHYRNYDGYFANKPELENLHRCITHYLRNERPIRDSLQGDLEYESFDDRFRQSLMDAIRQIEGKLSYGAEEFGAEDVIDRYDIDMYSLMTLMAFEDPTDLSVVQQSINEMSCDRDTVRWAINWWEEAWSGVPEETLNYLGLNYDDYNAEEFGAEGVNFELIPSVEIEGVGIVSEGSPYLKNNYDVKWDEYNIYDDDAAEVIFSIPANDSRMPLQEGELELITAMVYGFNHPLADASWGELNERRMFWAAKTMEELANYEPYEAEEFGAEFSRGEMLNLRKYIDYPMRWVNKNIRPSSDSKERKTEHKMKGQIPRRKTPDSFRHTIETPTWFKGMQIGILATIFGAMYVNETNKKRKK